MSRILIVEDDERIWSFLRKGLQGQRIHLLGGGDRR